MKRVFVVMMLATGLLSCAKENLAPQDENTEPAGIPVCFNINVAETKAAKTSWADGDVIYVFFKGHEKSRRVCAGFHKAPAGARPGRVFAERQIRKAK